MGAAVLLSGLQRSTIFLLTSEVDFQVTRPTSWGQVVGVTLAPYRDDGYCQRKCAGSKFSTDDRELGRPELPR